MTKQQAKAEGFRCLTTEEFHAGTDPDTDEWREKWEFLSEAERACSPPLFVHAQLGIRFWADLHRNLLKWGKQGQFPLVFYWGDFFVDRQAFRTWLVRCKWQELEFRYRYRVLVGPPDEEGGDHASVE